jgi:hypothetical protein
VLVLVNWLMMCTHTMGLVMYTGLTTVLVLYLDASDHNQVESG